MTEVKLYSDTPEKAKRADGFPRRASMEMWTPLEKRAWDLMQAIEKAGAHPYLTDAVVLMSAVSEKLADWVESFGDPPAMPFSTEP